MHKNFKIRLYWSLFSVVYLLSLNILSSPVLALNNLTESFVSTAIDTTILHGVFPGGQFGSSIDSADINNDGILDVLVGSPYTSVYSKQWNGATTIIFSGKADTNNKIHIYGEKPGDQLGTALATGDFNHDGKDDIAISAYNAALNNERPGAVYIVYGEINTASHMGGQEGSQVASPSSIQGSDFVSRKSNTTLYGHMDSGQFGLSMLSMDINQDGFDDLLIGEPGITIRGNKTSGAVYIYLGGKNGLNENYSISVSGQLAGEKFGSAITGGDYNNDKKVDLAISAYTSNSESSEQVGKVYLYSDIIGSGAVVNNPSSIIYGPSEKSWFGFAIDSGDANGDGIKDLLVSSFPYLGNKSDAGAFLYYGHNQFINNHEVDVSITEPEGEAMPGASAVLKDLNNDKKDDIIIGAPGISYMKSTEPGNVYIVFSDKNSSYKKNYSIIKKTDLNVIHGENSDDWFGYGLKSFDFNNDSLADLAISSRYSDTIDGVNNGKVFFLKGDGKPFGRIQSLSNSEGNEVSRAKLVKVIFESLDLRSKNAALLQNCYDHKEFCLFNFIAMSSYNDIKLDPDLILFPDVTTDKDYYQDVTDATILGLVNGYLEEKDSPFHPDLPVTRMQALKVILGAAGLVSNKYKFELIAMVGSYLELTNQPSYFYDVDAKIPAMWWYPRYVNYAVENNIISDGDFFRPNENITVDELNDFIINTLKLLNSKNEEN